MTFTTAAVSMVWIKTVYKFLRSGHETNHIARLLSAILAFALAVIGLTWLWLAKVASRRNHSTPVIYC